MVKLTDARIRANKKWDKKNKDKKNYIVAKSQAKRFINKFSTIDDLDTMLDLIKKRRAVLHESGIQ